MVILQERNLYKIRMLKNALKLKLEVEIRHTMSEILSSMIGFILGLF